MRHYLITRWVVPLYFAFLALESAIGGIRAGISGGPALAGQITGIVLCIVLGEMMYLRPEKWGMGVGIFILVMVAIQSFLWVIGGQHLSHVDPSFHWHVWRFACHEALNIVAAAICIGYHFHIPDEPNQSSEPTLASVTSPAGQDPRLP